MSKRLASFGGPSTPTSSPVAGQSTPTKSGEKKKPTPASPSTRISGSAHAPRNSPRKAKAQEETEIQCLVRTTLKRALFELKQWDHYFTKPGLQDAKWMVDQATELDNALGSLSSSEVQPKFRIVTGKLQSMDFIRDSLRVKCRAMSKRFATIVKRADRLERALTEFVQTHGIEAAEETPLWADKTWSLVQYGKFHSYGIKTNELTAAIVIHMHKILRPLNRFQHTAQELIEKIIAYSLSGGLNSDECRLPESERPESNQGATIPTFEETRGAMTLWAAESKAIVELIGEWEEMCVLEVVGWDKKLGEEVYSSDEDEDDETD